MDPALLYTAIFGGGGAIAMLFRSLMMSQKQLRAEMEKSKANCERHNKEIRDELTDLKNVQIESLKNLVVRAVEVMGRVEKIADRFSSSGQHLAVRDSKRDHA